MLADILSRDDIPTIIEPAMAQEAEARWQFLAPDRQAKDVEDCFHIIDLLGPIRASELAARCAAPLQPWLIHLGKANRIVETDDGWVSAQTQKTIETKNAAELALRYFRVRAPRTLSQAAIDLGLDEAALTPILEKLRAEKRLGRGQLLT